MRDHVQGNPDIDILLDFWLAGKSPAAAASKLGMTEVQCRSWVKWFRSNAKDVVNLYRPCATRPSRRRVDMTEKEFGWISDMRSSGAKDDAIARVLARSVEQVCQEETAQETAKSKEISLIVSTADLVMAYRYAFHVYKFRLISDKAYDALKKEEMEFGGKGSEISGNPRHYPSRIKSLALYLDERYQDTNNRKPPTHNESAYPSS